MAGSVEQKVLEQLVPYFVAGEVRVLPRLARAPSIGGVGAGPVMPALRASGSMSFISGVSVASVRPGRASGRLQHAVAGALHMGIFELLHKLRVNPLEFARKRGCQEPDPERGHGGLDLRGKNHLAKHLRKDIRAKRIELGPDIGQPLHRAHQGVEFGQHLLDDRQDLLQQAPGLDRLRHVGVIHQRKTVMRKGGKSAGRRWCRLCGRVRRGRAGGLFCSRHLGLELDQQIGGVLGAPGRLVFQQLPRCGGQLIAFGHLHALCFCGLQGCHGLVDAAFQRRPGSLGCLLKAKLKDIGLGSHLEHDSRD